MEVQDESRGWRKNLSKKDGIDEPHCYA